MKGIDNIVKAILDDAKTDVDATKKQTKEQIKQLKDKSKAEVQRQIAALEKETEKKSVELKRREKTILDVEIRRNNLMVKREMVNEAFDTAYSSLCNLGDADYAEIVSNMMLNAVFTSFKAPANQPVDPVSADRFRKRPTTPFGSASTRMTTRAPMVTAR